jgi:hypothetical protein
LLDAPSVLKVLTIQGHQQSAALGTLSPWISEFNFFRACCVLKSTWWAFWDPWICYPWNTLFFAALEINLQTSAGIIIVVLLAPGWYAKFLLNLKFI